MAEFSHKAENSDNRKKLGHKYQNSGMFFIKLLTVLAEISGEFCFLLFLWHLKFFAKKVF
jgi:hypothetical protein